MTDGFHTPVMTSEVVELLEPVIPGVVIDATFGGGGHSRRLIEEFGGDITIIGFDQDPAVAPIAEQMSVRFFPQNFGELENVVASQRLGSVNGVLFDLGVSSHQLDQAERGFSYRHPATLDMRMDPSRSLTAHDIVNSWSQDRLTQIILEYGEEPIAARIARAIVANRPIVTTTELVEVIKAVTPARLRRRSRHPARRTFQALRIAVNDELESLRVGLEAALNLLTPRGRCVVISYHSLEDRLVKQRFRQGAQGCVCPTQLAVCGCGRSPELRILTPKPLTPTGAEVAQNPRARSARLRAVQKEPAV